ncbi:MAG: hypothetical protein JXR76_26750 [Deltaproteobacteria bacterium]|nr:hypothetical protein [Deltaproteobacteria bacterium]
MNTVIFGKFRFNSFHFPGLTCCAVLLVWYFAWNIRALEPNDNIKSTSDDSISSVSNSVTDDNDDILIEQQTECLDGPKLQQALAFVLNRYPEKRQLMTIVASDAPTEAGANLHLRAIMKSSGEISLDRQFSLESADCNSAADLLSLVLEQFLTDFSVEQWRAEHESDALMPQKVASTEALEEKPTEKIVEKVVTREIVKEVVVEKDTATLAGFVFVGADFRWITPGVDFELGVAFDTGTSAHRLIAGSIYRATMPKTLGSGRYMENLFLLCVGWQYRAARIVVRSEVRVGAELISGFGYGTSYNEWNLQLEFNEALLFQLGAFRLGPQIGISPIRRHIFVAGGPKENLPNFRAGISFGKTF